MRILVIEDEVRLAATLADIISEENNTVDVCNDGECGLDNAMSGIYDAIVLDIMLPKLSGLDVLAALRNSGNKTPILLLTAKSELEDRVKGLDSGADYYLTKPFERTELLACLRAISRRGTILQTEILAIGNLVMDVSNSEIRSQDKAVLLSAKELELMRLLISNQNMFLPKETLFLKIWGYDTEAEINIVEVYISFLRRKIAYIEANVKISVQRRIGYKIEVMK